MSIFESKSFYLWYAVILLCVNLAFAYGLQKIGGSPYPNTFVGFFFLAYGIYRHIERNS